MIEITPSQYRNLEKGFLDPTLPTQVQSDIEFVRTILLSQQEDKFFVEFIELNELTANDIIDLFMNSPRASLIDVKGE